MEIKLEDGDTVEIDGKKYTVKSEFGTEPKFQLYY